jgi:hypothetical protein
LLILWGKKWGGQTTMAGDSHSILNRFSLYLNIVYDLIPTLDLVFLELL